MENNLVKNKDKTIRQILAYYVIFKNRVMFRDFWLPKAWGKSYKTRYYQYHVALNEDVAVFGGRSWGKCLTENALIHTNEGIKKIKDCLGIRNILQLDYKFKSNYHKARIYKSGIKKCFLLKTNSGKFIEATGEHKFFTSSGWKELNKINKNDLIAVSTYLKGYNNNRKEDINWLKILAYLIGNGSIIRVPIRFTDFNNKKIKDFYKSFKKIKGAEDLKITNHRKGEYHIIHPQGKHNNFIKRKLMEYGLYGKGSKYKFIPEFIFNLNKTHKSIFINRLFSTDGWAYAGNTVEIGYCSASYQLVKDIETLLLQMGIFSSICFKKTKCNNKMFSAWTLTVHYKYIKKFINEIGIFSKEKKCKEILNIFKNKSYDESKYDIIPYNFVLDAIRKKGFTKRQVARLILGADDPRLRNIKLKKYNLTKNKAKRIVNVIKDDELKNLIYGDIYWDKIRSIKYIGKKPVYDVSILNPKNPFENNFIANGFVAHNSVDLEATVVQTALNEPSTESLVTAFRKLHVRDRLERIISFFYSVKYWRAFLIGDANKTLKTAVKRSPTYEVKLKNRHMILGISTGDDPMCINLQGSHPCYRYLEEGQSFLREAWIKFQSARDPKFVRDRYYGITDGRIDTPFHDLDYKISKFKNKRFHISRRLEPWFNQETKLECIETFKGEESNEFIQQVDAEWGEAVWGVWPEKEILNSLDKRENPEVPGTFINQMITITLTSAEYAGMSPEQVLWNLPKLPELDLEVIMGIDGGYTEPTIILPFFYYKGKWNLWCKILLRDKIISDDQAELIDYIADFYSASIVAIDCTSAEGRDISQSLANPKRKEFINKRYAERLVWVDFRNTEVIGYKKIEFAETEINVFKKENEMTVVKETVKNLTTSELVRMFTNGKFHIYYDEDILEEFNRESQKKTPTGNYTIITPRDVHIPEAFRCFEEGTDILTENGWKCFNDLTYQDKLATLNIKNNLVEYKISKKIIKIHYEGKLLEYNSKTLKFSVTPEHNFLVKRNINKGWSDFEFVEAKNILYKGVYKIKRDFGKWKGKYRKKIKIGNYIFKIFDFIEFLGWYVSEGCIVNLNRSYRINISQKKYSEEIQQLLERLNIKFHRYKDKNSDAFVIFSKVLYKWLEENCYTGKPYKCFNKKIPNFIRELNSNLIKSFLYSFTKGDGYENEFKIILATVSKTLANDLLELILKIGKRANIIERNTTNINWKKVFIITISKKNKSLFSRIDNVTRKNFIEKEYNGYVYDVTIEPYHTIYVKYKGKSFWSGNCFAYGWWKKYGRVEHFQQQEQQSYSFVMPEYGDTGVSIFGRRSQS